MDIDLKGTLVRFIGLVLAVLGFILSVTMPVVARVLPSARTQMPEGLRDSAKDRKQPRLANRPSPGPASDSPPQRPAPTPSLSSTETLNNDIDSHNTVLSTASEVVVSTTLARHICNPRQCFKRAGTSASAHTSVERLPSSNMQRSASLDRALFTRTRSTYTNDALLSYALQLSPRSSIETDANGNMSRQRPSTASAAEAKTRTGKGPRRSLGLFGRRKSVKTASELAPMSSDVDSLPATPPNPSTLLPHMHEALYAIPSDSEDSLKQQRRRSLGELFRFKGKKKSRKEGSPLPALISGESATHDTNDVVDDHHDLDDGGQGLSSHAENSHPKDGLAKRCRQRKTHEPQLPPPRTRPYEAPYNFPSPLSPDAADYIRRTRETNSQRTNFIPFTSFSTGSLYPRRSRSKRSGKEEQKPQSVSTPDVPSTAPARRTTFNIPSHSESESRAMKPRHRRAESEELPSPTPMRMKDRPDEFGVQLRRPATTASATRPNTKRSALSV